MIKFYQLFLELERSSFIFWIVMEAFEEPDVDDDRNHRKAFISQGLY